MGSEMCIRDRSEAIEGLALASLTSGDDTIVWHPSRDSDRKGLIDMLGNVWEWFEDSHLGNDSSRLLGGGFFGRFADLVESSGFDIDHPVARYGSVGFRLCRELSS